MPFHEHSSFPNKKSGKFITMNLFFLTLPSNFARWLCKFRPTFLPYSSISNGFRLNSMAQTCQAYVFTPIPPPNYLKFP